MSAAHRKKTHHICKEKPMPELSHIDPGSAALLVMDYQVDNLTRFMTAAQSADAIACVPDLIATSRDAGMMIHVVVAFRPGHPEVSPRNPDFSAVQGKRNAGGRERRRRDPSGRSGTRGGANRGQAPRQPVRWHRPGDALQDSAATCCEFIGGDIR